MYIMLLASGSGTWLERGRARPFGRLISGLRARFTRTRLLRVNTWILKYHRKCLDAQGLQVTGSSTFSGLRSRSSIHCLIGARLRMCIEVRSTMRSCRDVHEAFHHHFLTVTHGAVTSQCIASGVSGPIVRSSFFCCFARLTGACPCLQRNDETADLESNAYQPYDPPSYHF